MRKVGRRPGRGVGNDGGEPVGGPLRERLAQWAEQRGLPVEFTPGKDAFLDAPGGSRPPARLADVVAWEDRHGFVLPSGLRDWLLISNGLHIQGTPWIHPLSGIGPMVQFARMPGLVVQPESWFELGNPNVETVCIDLSYSWPEGGPPIFTSGDDLSGSAPRLIARSFDEWFVELIRRGGREYWFDPAFRSLGHPWSEHRRRSPAPPLPTRLRPLAGRALPLMSPDADDRSVALELGVTRGDVEALFRHLQHVPGAD